MKWLCNAVPSSDFGRNTFNILNAAPGVEIAQRASRGVKHTID